MDKIIEKLFDRFFTDNQQNTIEQILENLKTIQENGLEDYEKFLKEKWQEDLFFNATGIRTSKKLRIAIQNAYQDDKFSDCTWETWRLASPYLKSDDSNLFKLKIENNPKEVSNWWIFFISICCVATIFLSMISLVNALKFVFISKEWLTPFVVIWVLLFAGFILAAIWCFYEIIQCTERNRVCISVQKICKILNESNTNSASGNSSA